MLGAGRSHRRRPSDETARDRANEADDFAGGEHDGDHADRPEGGRRGLLVDVATLVPDGGGHGIPLGALPEHAARIGEKAETSPHTAGIASRSEDGRAVMSLLPRPREGGERKRAG
jgi:hypothetical protein